jgi:heavy metal response regulator
MRLLIVEDDTNMARFLQKGLQEERYAVDVMTDGEKGLLVASVTPYDLIILDVMLPKLDGLAVCARLRAERKMTPILLLTALESVESKVDGLNAGADDYLTKPFAFVELIARVRALLRRGSGQQQSRFKAADLVLDSVSHRVWRGGREIVLTNKEFALLEYLLRNADQVLTRTAIVEHIWDIHFDSMTNIVDVHVRALRAKMDRDFSPALIHTVRGVGYMLKMPEE